MSSYLRNTKNPKTGKFEGAFWIDDKLGPHHYGVIFQDGSVVDPHKIKLETNDKKPKVTWDDWPKINSPKASNKDVA